MTTLREVKEKLTFDTYSLKAGVFTVRYGFFYTHGRTDMDCVNDVLKAFPAAKILGSGEVWKNFKGGASVANQSHWFVKFTVGG